MAYNILFDNSGKMSELGKSQLLKNALRFLLQYIENNSIDEKINFYQFGKSVSTVDVNTKKQITLNSPEGTYPHKEIETFLKEDNENIYLWLTDGHFKFSKNGYDALKNRKIWIISIGCDANNLNSSRVSENIYSLPDIATASDHFFMNNNPIETLPVSLKFDNFETTEVETVDEW